MFQDSSQHQLFPTTLWKFRLDGEVALKLNEDIVSLLDAAIGERPFPPNGVYQTGHDFHLQPAVAPLVKYIETAGETALEAMATRHRALAITGCWANVAAPGAVHTRHCHPNNFLSGVYYVSAPPDANAIIFDDPRPHWMHMAPDTHENPVDYASTVTVPLSSGMLILFPAWLMHYVPQNRSEMHRISIAFNLMFRDFAEKVSPPKWTPSLIL